VKSRRRFLKLVAMTSAAALVPAAPRGARAATKNKPAPAPAARPTALETELKKQKHSTAQALKAIRDFELPPGSEPAFVFSAQRAPRRHASNSTRTTAKGGTR
jgi:hypothetical protein